MASGLGVVVRQLFGGRWLWFKWREREIWEGEGRMVQVIQGKSKNVMKVWGLNEVQWRGLQKLETKPKWIHDQAHARVSWPCVTLKFVKVKLQWSHGLAHDCVSSTFVISKLQKIMFQWLHDLSHACVFRPCVVSKIIEEYAQCLHGLSHTRVSKRWAMLRFSHAYLQGLVGDTISHTACV